MIAPLNPTIPPAAFAPEPARPPARSGGCGCGERGVVLTLLGGAALWLVAGALLSLLAALKLVSPSLLAACPHLTYGRIYPAGLNVLLFGFASQAALAVTLYLICRIGTVSLRFGVAACLGALAWNVGVAVGLFEILAGNATGFEWLEMPRSAAGILLAGYLLIALSALKTLRDRTVQTLAVSQWYLIGALFAFPWLYSGGVSLLLCVPVRGVVQASVNAWFTAGFSHLWLGAVVTAILFHFLPQSAGRPVANESLARFGFWSLMIVGAWTGLAPGAPLPGWLVSASGAMAALLLVPASAVVVNLWNTVQGDWRKLFAGFFGVALAAYALWILVLVLAACPRIGDAMRFGGFEATKLQLCLLMASAALTGAAYRLVPELLGREWPAPKLLVAHWQVSLLGLVLAFSSPFGGKITFALAFLLGAVLFALNLVQIGLAHCRATCDCREWFAADAGRAGA
jgi:cytochrome c oxidase cbb3-type subunit 1